MKSTVLALWKNMDIVMFTTIAHQVFAAADALKESSGDTRDNEQMISSSDRTPAHSLVRADALIQ